uniref:NADH-ubiquinone oxidoreductase chain 2 n=2 Tax=Amolops TaxID=109940 RepID=C5H726_9NEOB|nr:NADH dehydrogenase subunit 2 [Amolops afghanus]ACR77911.1 NADH dehydrogenase subunit 2 [Amolops afghanus]
MNPIPKTLLLLSLATGTTIALSSYHWLIAWVGLEINTMAIIPIMTLNPHPRAIEAATKYFLTQATASALILFSNLVNAWQTGEWEIPLMINPSFDTLSIALMMKLGLAPLHLWLPEVLQGIPLPAGLLVSTWQKIAPMVLLLQTSHLLNPNLTTALGLTSILIGGWGGIAQTQLRKLMAFSSISHLGWIIIIMKFNPQLAIFNFIIYILLTTSMFISLMLISATKMSDLATSWPKSPALTMTTVITLLSLAGLPPLSGFAPKLLISMELIKQDLIILSTITILASLLSMFFYLRLAYIIMLTIPPNIPNSLTPWRKTTKLPLIVATPSTLAMLLLPLTPTILNLI